MQTTTDKDSSGKNILNVAFSANDAYVPYMCVAIRSIIDNLDPEREAHIHILTEDYTEESLQRIAEIFKGCGNVGYTIHRLATADTQCFDSFEMGRYTNYSWFRLLLPALLPDIDKILYLDTDILVTDDLSSLAEFDMGDAAIATPMDTDTFIDDPFIRCGYPKEKQYVCVGVLLMNLEIWRQKQLSDKAIAWGLKHSKNIIYPDQDSVNYVCRDMKTYLPLRYGVTKSVFTQPWFYAPQYREQLRECLERPAIIHYAGCAPWLRESNHPFTSLWIDINKKMPRPVKRVFKTKGWLGLKLRLWDLLHPGYDRQEITPEEIRRRLDALV